MHVDDPLAFQVLELKEMSTNSIHEYLLRTQGKGVNSKVIQSIKLHRIHVCECCGVEFYPYNPDQACCNRMCTIQLRRKPREVPKDLLAVQEWLCKPWVHTT